MRDSISFLTLLILICGCITELPTTPATTTLAEELNQMANPASVKCIENGGKLRVVTESAGQRGICLFPDGSVCDEWAFFNGNCSKGSCMMSCEAIGTRSEGWYDCNGDLLYWDNCGSDGLNGMRRTGGC